MHLLVTGASGMTGSEVVRQSEARGWQCTAFSHRDLDITDANAVRSALMSAAPDVVVNAAAYTAVDQAETDEQAATLVNAKGAENLASVTGERGAAIIHISTDYVFDGAASEPYLPTDPTNPNNSYGRSKLAGEIAVRFACPRHLIVRTSWVYSHEGHNFVRTMLRQAETGNELTVVDDQHGSPTSAADLALALVLAADAIQRDDALNGTYHFTNSGVTTWYDFAKTIFEMRNLESARVRPVSTSEYRTAARRPLWSVLDCTSFAKQFAVTPRPWRAALKETLERIQ
ncbi:MAG: dTDP-4-dehydrorhamnose reductase [Gemmatimonadales bacterium]